MFRLKRIIPLDEIDPDHVEMVLEIHALSSQIEAINHLAFDDSSRSAISQYSNFEFDEVLVMQLIIIISTKLINDK